MSAVPLFSTLSLFFFLFSLLVLLFCVDFGAVSSQSVSTGRFWVHSSLPPSDTSRLRSPTPFPPCLIISFSLTGSAPGSLFLFAPTSFFPSLAFPFLLSLGSGSRFGHLCRLCFFDPYYKFLLSPDPPPCGLHTSFYTPQSFPPSHVMDLIPFSPLTLSPGYPLAVALFRSLTFAFTFFL